MLKNHPHPGELLREDVLKPLGIGVLNGRVSISPDVAIRLERSGVSTRAAGRKQPPVKPLQAA